MIYPLEISTLFSFFSFFFFISGFISSTLRGPNTFPLFVTQGPVTTDKLKTTSVHSSDKASDDIWQAVLAASEVLIGSI